MADYARKGNLSRTIRSHSEQVRRIRTRIPTSGTVATSIYQVTNADMSMGWDIEGYPFPAFVRQGDIVMLNGMFGFSGPVGATMIAAGKIPAEFRPYRQTRIPGQGAGFDDDRQWVMLLNTDGKLEVASVHSSPTRPSWMGFISDSGSEVISVATTYPAVDLNLGDFPP